MAQIVTREYSGLWFHVMTHGIRGEVVFTGPGDYKAFLDILMEASKLWDVGIAAYCLLPNRYHLLLQTEPGNLSRCISYIKWRYTAAFRKLHGGRGSLFQRGYKAVPVDEDAYLFDLVRYIHRIPVQEGLSDKVDVYEWTSHRGYISETAQWNWLRKDVILSIISEKKR